MLSITLPPELEDALSRSAREQGTTPELLALDSLHERFAPQSGNPMGQKATLPERSPQDAMKDALPQTSALSSAESSTQEQKRLHQLVESVLTKTRALAEQPLPSAEAGTDNTPEETEYGVIVTEKFRRQGFNL